ncbi:hypothetical protein NT6N_08590 [Oceaniferula spumae]|uniref:Uncharacterized protein n=1 Tax=Oceaniferula spumae TaxID=2979115 RepID=A0AAT9FIL3_9BACT
MKTDYRIPSLLLSNLGAQFMAPEVFADNCKEVVHHVSKEGVTPKNHSGLRCDHASRLPC